MYSEIKKICEKIAGNIKICKRCIWELYDNFIFPYSGNVVSGLNYRALLKILPGYFIAKKHI